MSLNAADRLEILELANRYNDAVDSHDPEAWVATFAPDGAVDSPFGQPRGTEGLRAWITAVIGMLSEGTRHLTLGAIVDEGPEEGTATMRSSYLVFGRDKAPPTLGATGGYVDRLRKIDGRWRFIHRTHSVDASYAKQEIG
jgi:ketosteroid isomerase-like protein